MQFEDVLRKRKSVRQFTRQPVPRALIEDILQLSALSPSGTNIQPWKVHVVMGEKRDELVAEVLAHRETNPEDKVAEFPRSSKRKEPYIGRMRKLGKDMYTLLEIPKGDAQANWDQWGRNYMFFDAPVGLVFTIDKDLDAMSFLDIGMFMQTIMLVAAAKGLATCSQGAWNQFHTATRRVLNIPDEDYIICGMSLGYEDTNAAVNKLVAEREPLSAFATFHGN